MHRTVNDCMSSHNNMLVPEEEIVIERTITQQEESLRKENQELKVPTGVGGTMEGGGGMGGAVTVTGRDWQHFY